MMRRRFLTSESGASAVEFALVLPAFLVLLLGTIHMCLLLYSSQTLHSAVEAGARCAAVRTGTGQECSGDKTTTVPAFALSQYWGPGISPSFQYWVSGAATCITGTGSYTISAVLVNTTVPLSASACFPTQ